MSCSTTGLTVIQVHGLDVACRYAVQYEDGDKEEFVACELTKGGKKSMLQPSGKEDRTDHEELDRLYIQAQAEWAAGEHSVFWMYDVVLDV